MKREFIYFVRAGENGRVKIGRTGHVPRRLAKMQTDSGEKLNLLGVIVGSAAVERDLHDKLSEFRAQGEWFDAAPELLAAIEDEIAISAPVSLTAFRPKRQREPRTKLDAYLLAHGLRDHEFAERIGTSRPHVTFLRNGQRQPSLAIVGRILKATGGAVGLDAWIPVEVAA